MDRHVRAMESVKELLSDGACRNVLSHLNDDEFVGYNSAHFEDMHSLGLTGSEWHRVIRSYVETNPECLVI